ncbi:MAG TPA: type II toxin-antitoxin system VapC family toxin [Rhizomicrobium sp.]
MRLLLDSNIVVPLTRHEVDRLNVKIRSLLTQDGNEFVVSVVSLWEIAIKTRIGKLAADIALADLPAYLTGLGYSLLPIDEDHALAELADDPLTRDPFDRMLLAQCQIEGLKLVTADRALVDHPLAWRAP